MRWLDWGFAVMTQQSEHHTAPESTGAWVVATPDYLRSFRKLRMKLQCLGQVGSDSLFCLLLYYCMACRAEVNVRGFLIRWNLNSWACFFFFFFAILPSMETTMVVTYSIISN